jgi:hypothetical protein
MGARLRGHDRERELITRRRDARLISLRRCGRPGSRASGYPGPIITDVAISHEPGLWVPAFAGTTACWVLLVVPDAASAAIRDP